MPKPSRTLKPSLSPSAGNWLDSVMSAYHALAHQWCVLSTMIQFAPPPGWQASLEPLSLLTLWGSPGLLSSLNCIVNTETCSNTDTSNTFTTCSSSTTPTFRVTLPLLGRSPQRRRRPPAPTRAKSTTSKRATWRSARRRSTQ